MTIAQSPKLTADAVFDSIIEACDKRDPELLRRVIDQMLTGYPAQRTHILLTFHRYDTAIQGKIARHESIGQKWINYTEMLQAHTFDDVRNINKPLGR